MNHGERDIEKVGLRAPSDQLLCPPGIQISRVKVPTILGNLGVISKVVSPSSGQTTFSAPVVDCSRIGTKEGVKTTIGRSVPSVTVAQMPLAFTYLHLSV